MLGENMLNSIGSDYQGVQVETSAWRQTLTRGKKITTLRT